MNPEVESALKALGFVAAGIALFGVMYAATPSCAPNQTLVKGPMWFVCVAK